MPVIGKEMIDYLQKVTWGHKNQPGERFDPDLESTPESDDENEGMDPQRQRLRPAVVNGVSYGMGADAMRASFYDQGSEAGPSNGH